MASRIFLLTQVAQQLRLLVVATPGTSADLAAVETADLAERMLRSNYLLKYDQGDLTKAAFFVFFS